MDYEETIDLFQAGKLEIDCRSITLTQLAEPFEVYKGKGYIRQSDDGTLEFRVYVFETENVKPFASFNRLIGGPVGSLHTDDMYFDLVATSRDGTVWASTRVMAKFQWDMTQEVNAVGQLYSMRSQTQSQETFTPFLELHFFDDLTVPLFQMSEKVRFGQRYMETDKAEFECSSCKWTVQKRDNRVIVEAESLSGNLTPNFDLRVQEATQFLTAQPVFWRARLAGTMPTVEFELMSPWRKPKRTQMSVPISRATEGYFQKSWGLFCKYLDYLVANVPGTQWHPAAYHLYNASESSGASVDAWAVGYCVCLEALASFVPFPEDPDRSARIKGFQDKVNRWLDEQADDPDLVQRLKGLAGGLSQDRPQDKLYALAKSGHITEVYIKSWIKLRNKHVHPKPADLRRPDAGYMQEMFDLIHQVETLIYQIIFFLIGYEGPYTDYGSSGFPMGQYPLHLASHQTLSAPEGGGDVNAQKA